jgi:hypothetical protein
MEGIRQIFISLPLFIALLIPILICLGYTFLSVRIIVTANKEKDIAKLKIGQRSFVKALVALTIVLMVCYFIYN